MNHQLHFDKRKMAELYRQIMNVLERNGATTEEGFTALVTGLKTIVEDPSIMPNDRLYLKKKIIDAMQAELVRDSPQIILPDMVN